MYDTIVWSWMKKSAKSTIIAAVAHYVACHKPNAQIAFIANDLRQASSRVGFYLRESIKLGKKNGLSSSKGVQVPVRESGTIRYPNGSRIEMLPIDPTGEAGSNYDMIVFSELWGWKHTAHTQMWAELTISPNRFGYAQRWVDTYAGYSGESPILEPLYEHIVKHGQQIWEDLEVYENGRQMATWVTKPMLSWQTDEYYASESQTLTPDQFQRMHRNQWTSSSMAFVDAHRWADCKGVIPDDALSWNLVVAVDAGVSSDCFGIVVVARRNNLCYPVIIKKWQPAHGQSIDFALPLAFIEDLVERYHIQVVTYDPTQLHHMMTTLRQQSTVWVQKFEQGRPRELSDRRLYDMIMAREIVHDGNEELTEHILNANRNENTGKDDNKFRITKRSNTAKNDLAVALSMAVDTAMRLNL
jgi:phage terminase large subunit-like protein